ncbi:lysosomal thioesterase PPT2-like [Salarias fasciatus]|uniref:palmitoyl-CoA hydrolase n=1 Tax=Salarias fasciatus TaxID=181472 RepID=A0A672G3V6_SALFA|nr:lysosomal thioesterase PPT2-like [Salarias fasciatus]
MRSQLLLLLCAVVCSGGFKPVVIVHGLFDGPKQFQTLSEFIRKDHPGTDVTLLSAFDYLDSLQPLWKQVRTLAAVLQGALQRPGGVHLLCFSQGGLVCRALLSISPQHNVHSFISLSSPQAGQYGDTDYLKKFFPKYLKEALFHFCYTEAGQKVSICNYWNDPHQQSRFLQKNHFLPLINGGQLHNQSAAWRENFLRIRKLVLIGGPDDDVITPWQSSVFGFYDSREQVADMRDQEFYRTDAFGLRTLDARGDVSLCVHAGVKHVQWHSNYSVFHSCMKKWLT